MQTDEGRDPATQPADADPARRRLANPQHEAFARFRARGRTQIDAYEAAGYRRQSSSASILAHRPEVEARIAWLAQREATLMAATPEATLIGLLAIVDAGRRADGAACAQETRLALRAVLDLSGQLDLPRRPDPLQIAKAEQPPQGDPAGRAPDFEPLDTEAWKAKYGPGGWYWGGRDPT